MNDILRCGLHFVTGCNLSSQSTIKHSMGLFVRIDRIVQDMKSVAHELECVYKNNIVRRIPEGTVVFSA